MGFRVADRLDVNIGGFYIKYVPVTIYTTEQTSVGSDATHYMSKTFEEKRFSVAIGVTYRFLSGEIEQTIGDAGKTDIKSIKGLKTIKQ